MNYCINTVELICFLWNENQGQNATCCLLGHSQLSGKFGKGGPLCTSLVLQKASWPIKSSQSAVFRFRETNSGPNIVTPPLPCRDFTPHSK